MKAPVFVVGCPRSGTTLLYSLLVAAGGFAIYRKETYFYDLVRRFPDLTSEASRQQFASRYLEGYLGKVPGLDVEPLVRQALERCHESAEFLPLLMSEITAAQGMERWIEATPIHAVYLDEIKRAVPDALFVHVIRDGRDCALSNVGQHWIPALPWDGQRRLEVAALFWEWVVRTCRASAPRHRPHYLEITFEELIADPASSLARVGQFIDHDLDYERIRRNPVHAMKQPNTTFRAERDRPDFNPVGRWTKCSQQELAQLDRLIGPYLQQLGYPRTPGTSDRADRLRAVRMRATYLTYFSSKHWLKAHSPIGRFVTNTRVWAEQPKAGEEPIRQVEHAVCREA